MGQHATTQDDPKFREFLKRAAEKTGGLKKLAEKTGFNFKTLEKWRYGERRPENDQAKRDAIDLIERHVGPCEVVDIALPSGEGGRLREEYGWTLEEIGAMLELTDTSQIARWDMGLGTPAISKMYTAFIRQLGAKPRK